jgi:hypothetical protein
MAFNIDIHLLPGGPRPWRQPDRTRLLTEHLFTTTNVHRLELSTDISNRSSTGRPMRRLLPRKWEPSAEPNYAADNAAISSVTVCCAAICKPFTRFFR